MSSTYLGAVESAVSLGGARSSLAIFTPDPPWEDDLSELFLDLEHVASSTGVTLSVPAPAKDAGNPLLAPAGDDNDTWDYQKAFCALDKVDGQWRGFYAGRATALLKGNPCYTSSVDGVTWTKPNMGLVTYGGNTNNNMLFVGGFTNGRYYPELDKWVILTETDLAGAATACIWTADDPGGPWSMVNTIDLVPGSDTNQPKDLLQLPNGQWVMYLVTGYSNEQRRIFAGVADDIDGTFVNAGTVIPYLLSTHQPYGIAVQDMGGIYVAPVMVYDSPAELMHMDLYVSRDGFDFEQVKEGWIPRGANGTWDDSMIFNGCRIAEDGNAWHCYYVGSPVPHETTPPKDMRIGRVSMGKRRIAQVDGTGSITTVLLTPGAATALHVNVDASGGGKLEVEILDAAGQPITGYGTANATDITTDTFDTTAAWSGGALPTGSPIRLVFHLTDATLYSYEIR